MTLETIIRLFHKAGASKLYYTDPEAAQRVAQMIANAERESVDELLSALQDLLMDTQHAEHKCADKSCPVARAVKVALKYDARRQS